MEFFIICMDGLKPRDETQISCEIQAWCKQGWKDIQLIDFLSIYFDACIVGTVPPIIGGYLYEPYFSNQPF